MQVTPLKHDHHEIKLTVLRALAFRNEIIPSQTFLSFPRSGLHCTMTLSQGEVLMLETLEQPVTAHQSLSCEWLLPG